MYDPSDPRPFEVQLAEHRMRNDNLAYAIDSGWLSVQEAILVMSVPGFRPIRTQPITTER
jgi:hypothetical protein